MQEGESLSEKMQLVTVLSLVRRRKLGKQQEFGGKKGSSCAV